MPDAIHISNMLNLLNLLIIYQRAERLKSLHFLFLGATCSIFWNCVYYCKRSCHRTQ